LDRRGVRPRFFSIARVRARGPPADDSSWNWALGRGSARLGLDATIRRFRRVLARCPHSRFPHHNEGAEGRRQKAEGRRLSPGR
jgi:hypothetical protein